MELGELITLYLVDLQAAFRKHILFDNITLTQALILLTLPDDGLDMTSLSLTIGVDNSTATRLADNLIKKGWVWKKRNEQDRRMMVVRLTDSGDAIRDKIEKRIDRYGEKLAVTIPPGDREETREILLSFYWNMVRSRIK